MKSIKEMSMGELAAYLQAHLQKAGIKVVLSGGGAVSFYSGNLYVSKDIDLIDNGLASRKEIRQVLSRLGFQTDGRYFRHTDTELLIEFPGGPLSVGEQLIRQVKAYPLETGELAVISATDCVKDRLCAYYYWHDRQGLAQAVMVAQKQQVDLADIRQWSIREGHLEGFTEFEKML